MEPYTSDHNIPHVQHFPHALLCQFPPRPLPHLPSQALPPPQVEQ